MCVNPNGHQYIPIETKLVGQTKFVMELMCIYCRDFQKINRPDQVYLKAGEVFEKKEFV